MSEIKTIDNKPPYDLDRQTAMIPALSSRNVSNINF